MTPMTSKTEIELIFLYVHIGGLSGISDLIARDIDYFIDCYYMIVETFFTKAVG